MKTALFATIAFLSLTGMGEGVLLHYPDVRDRAVQGMPVPFGGVVRSQAISLSTQECGGHTVSATVVKLPDMAFVAGVPRNQHRWTWLVELRGTSLSKGPCVRPALVPALPGWPKPAQSVVVVIDYGTGEVVKVSSPAPDDGGPSISEE